MPGFSEAGKAAGHTGSALIEVSFQPDGAAESVKIVESSRSDLLDAEALAAVGEAKIPAGSEVRRFLLTVQFNPTGILETKCDEFVRQLRWYEAAWPERTREDAPIYTATVGFVVLARSRAEGVRAGLEAAVGQGAKIRSAYDATIEQCESKPQQSYLQLLSRLMR
ncbi:TonB family protein [Brevundimonas sp.]|uniref:TonB family protein n=1 Tax=Brevundimonas sp. TaxID=1871086 RepID=UPI003D6C7F5E